MVEDVILWSTKLKLAITTPTILKGGVPGTKNVYTFERLSISRNREQRTINSVAGARKGFVTVEGDFSLTISLPETDPNTQEIEKLYSSNQMFDVALMENIGSDIVSPGEWKIAQAIAYGCMFENVSTSYDANDKPMREYTAKFLKSTIKNNDSTETSQRDGNYATGSVVVKW